MTNSLSFALHINEHAFDHKMFYVEPVILGFRLIKKKGITHTQRKLNRLNDVFGHGQ